MGAIIWQKVTTCNTTGGATIMGSFPNPRNGILKLDYEFILIFKKTGKAPKVSKEIKEQSKMTTKEWNQYFTGHWHFAGEKQDRHLAMFPEELPKRLIRMYSFVNDTILDPFLGSGTTSLAAKNLNRNSIGYEINEDFLPLIEDKLGMAQKLISGDHSFEIIRQPASKKEFASQIENLPYVFHDPVKFDKKVDPRKLQFGSRIDNNHSKREKYFSVKEVVSSNRLVLDNGLKVKLLGVSEKPKTKEDAVRFLTEKTKGQKVFMKFDQQKYDEEDNLLCYLYLQNKTFLNAHLIKLGLADADDSLDYKYKAKFLIESGVK
jgi:site-specific DNA-methyltransferase (adenine-specific)